MAQQMDHLLEDSNLSLAKDTVLFNGQTVAAGAKITFVSKQGCYNGFNMRVPPPEFEALMIFSAIEAAEKAELIKKTIDVSKGDSDGMEQITDEVKNRAAFFSMCQHSMTAATFSISAIESWANKSIMLYGIVDGKPQKLSIQRPNKTEKIVMSNNVASDTSIPIRPKIFQLVPQVFKVEQLKSHSKFKESVGSLVDERNIVMHMQAKLRIAEDELERVSYAIKLFKTNTLNAPETVLKYISFIYDKSDLDTPEWLGIAQDKIKYLRRNLK